MATVALLSAKGSPGASTVTVGLTLAWSTVMPSRSALAVDADPAGGDFAAGILGGALPPSSGVIPLATARGLPAAEAVESASVHLRPDGTAQLLAGVPDSSRSGALSLAWDVLVEARPGLSSRGTDLLVDAGRVDLARPSAPWLTDADLALLVVRPTLPAVTAARRFAAAWSASGAATASTPMEVVIVDAASPYRPREVAEAVGLPCCAVVPFDPVHARVHSEGHAPTRAFPRSPYWRAIRGLADALGARLELPAPALEPDTSGHQEAAVAPDAGAPC